MTFFNSKKAAITKSFKAIAVSAMVVTMTSAAFTTPATAGGSFSFNVTPQTGEEADAMRIGLALFSVFNAIENGSGIVQNGHNNSAGVGQNGFGNSGVVYQEGNGHSGTLQQNGNNNSHGLFQFGENTEAHVNQNGNGQTGATFVFGWN